MPSVVDFALENLQSPQVILSRYFDKKQLPELEYKVGDLVMLDPRNIKTTCPTRKLAPKSPGLLTITRVGTRTCTMHLGAWCNIFHVIHISLLGLYRKSVGANQKHDRPPVDNMEEDLGYKMESIIQSEKRVRGPGAWQSTGMFCLVKWLGYPNYECSGEPVEVIEGLLELMKEFHIAHCDMPKL